VFSLGNGIVESLNIKTRSCGVECNVWLILQRMPIADITSLCCTSSVSCRVD
jgi:hypothetical protein